MPRSILLLVALCGLVCGCSPVKPSDGDPPQDRRCDGEEDCNKPDCAGAACGAFGRLCQGTACVCPGGGSEAECANGLDDDCDGQADCVDPDCSAASCGAGGLACQGTTCACPSGSIETVCADGADNDCDGLSDCADPNCAGVGSCPCLAQESDCADGRDDDCDGVIDCADEDCRFKSCDAQGRTCYLDESCRCARQYWYAHWELDPQVEQPWYCSNQLDDDCDGLTDCNDPDCRGGSDETACSDGVDNDCDGLVDCLEPGCKETGACGGVRADPEQCNDGEDDDLDGLIDCADPECDRKACGIGWCPYNSVVACHNQSCGCAP